MLTIRFMLMFVGLAAAAAPLLAQDATISARNSASDTPLFTRHVVPLFSRLGCNAGACHGAVQGKNGFRLSLFGADPVADHQRLLREFGGRRLNFSSPSSSLLLQKATGQIAHEGGRLLDADSADGKMLLKWIGAGAPLDVVERSRVSKLEVTPAQYRGKAGDSYPLKVRATFSDGTSEDVTRLSTFECLDLDVAIVDRAGTVKMTNPGQARLIVRFRGQPLGAQALAASQTAGEFPKVAEHNFIDKQILDRLRTLNIHPSGLCDDATFLRRVSLDLAGELPTPDEIRKFLADKSADKRAKKIDELLARPGHASLWATKFCDILKPVGFNGNDKLYESVEARRFFEWLRDRIAAGMPYDDLVEHILTATSREERPIDTWAEETRHLAGEAADSSLPLAAYGKRKTLDLYWQKSRGSADGGNVTVKNGMLVAHAFLGLRLECAQCHRHPNDVWQQDDLLSFANFFSRVSSGTNAGSSAEARKDTKRLTEEAKKLRAEAMKLSGKGPQNDKAKALNLQAQTLEGMAGRLGSTEIYVVAKGAFAATSSPLGKQNSSAFRLLGQTSAIIVPDGKDPRTVVMAWLRQPDNPYFAKAIVNRVWAHYFGRGIIDPPDHLSPLNSPTHSELLDELCQGFIKNKYDLKWLHRAIVSSRTYQQASQANPSNRDDRRNYARFYLRRMSAELAIDAINHATGGSETYPKELRMPAGARAIELAGTVQPQNDQPKTIALAYALQVFGRPKRSPEVQCDCERENAPGIVQTLYIVNHPAVREKLIAPDGRAAKIAAEQKTPEARAEEAFLWVLSRQPSADERSKAVAYLNGSPSQGQGVAGLIRTLMLADEFILNH